MSSKGMNSGELLSSLNKNIDRSHHNKNDIKEIQKIVVKNNQEQLTVPSQISKKESQEQISIQKENIHVKSVPREQQLSVIPKRDTKQIKQVQRLAQNETSRSNLSRATQIKNKRNKFKQTFQNAGYQIQQEEVGQTLHEILAMQIGKLISEPLAQVIEATMKQKQNTIYIAFTRPDKDYLQNLILLQKKKENNNISDIQTLLFKRQNRTIQKLDNGELYIDQERSITTKSQLQQLSKLDVARLLKIKQGSIRSKLDLLQDKMFEFQSMQKSSKTQSPTQSLKKYQQQKLEQICDPNNFGLASQKTKIANDYVKHLQHQKILLLKKMREREQKRNQLQKQREMELKQAQQMRNAAKKQQVQQRIVQYKKKKELQVKQVTQKSKKVEDFLKQHRISLPLYKKKQRQFGEIYQKKRQKDIQQKLKEIKQNRRSLSLHEMKQHQDKYLQRKSLEQQKKEEDLKMMRKAKQASESGKQYFKGFYHQKVKLLDQEERLKFYSLRDATKLKVQRMTEFDKQIRKLHQPKVDQEKRESLQRVIQFDELKKKKIKKVFKQVQGENGQFHLQAYYQEIPQVDHYKQGNKYMQISKSLAKKQKPGETSRYQEEPQINLQELQQSRIKKTTQPRDWETPSPVLQQQKEIWRLRSKQLHQLTDQISPSNFYQSKKNLQVMDSKAKLRQQLIKHKDSDAHEMMHEKSMLDQFYLESIKNKIKLLNQ